MSEEAKNVYYANLIKKFNKEEEPEKSSDSEYDPGDIDINDYIPATECETVDNVFKADMNIINILSEYYKQAHSISDNRTIFDGLDVEDMSSTNKMMEFVYGEIFRYNESNIPDKDTLYNPDTDINIDSYKELYCLMISDEPKFISPFVLPITMYLALQDWVNMDWYIIDVSNA
jgi:hypothetical protein